MSDNSERDRLVTHFHASTDQPLEKRTVEESSQLLQSIEKHLATLVRLKDGLCYALKPAKNRQAVEPYKFHGFLSSNHLTKDDKKSDIVYI